MPAASSSSSSSAEHLSSPSSSSPSQPPPQHQPPHHDPAAAAAAAAAVAAVGSSSSGSHTITIDPIAPIAPIDSIDSSNGNTHQKDDTITLTDSLSTATATATASDRDGASASATATPPPTYLDYARALRSAWVDIPDVTITYQNISYTVPISLRDDKIHTLLNTATDLLSKPFRSNPIKYFQALAPSSGILHPGTLSLVLSPPGHGKSTYLKSLAGKFCTDPNFAGQIKWNNMNKQQTEIEHVNLGKLCTYVGETDIHLPLLTVRETFLFAQKNAVADVKLLNDPQVNKLNEQRVDLMIQLLGLTECQHTIVGNALIRGVSGGERKRVTIGEMLLTNSRVLLLDEITTGLDAAVAFDIINMLHNVCRTLNSTIVISLLQPSPELFELFDQLILLREGSIVYHGPRNEIISYLAACDIHPPTDQDTADWLIELLTDPKTIYIRNLKKSYQQSLFLQQKTNLNPSATTDTTDTTDPTAPTARTTITISSTISAPVVPIVSASSISTHERRPSESVQVLNWHNEDDENVAVIADQSSLITDIDPPLTTHALVEQFHSSSIYQTMLSEIDQYEKTTSIIHKSQVSLFTQHQYYSTYCLSLWTHTWLNVSRQFTLMSRNKQLVFPRIFQNTFMALIIGSLYYQGDSTKFNDKIGLMLFACISVCFSNMVEVPIAAESKLVVHKHVDASLYPTLSYILSVILANMPLAVTEVSLFGSIIYWMSGFTNDAGRFFFWLLLLLTVNLSMGSFFRCIAFALRNQDVAQQMAAPINGIWMMFGGFLITEDRIRNYFIWLYWISPFSWAVRSLAQNEFFSDRYDEMMGPPGHQQRVGDVYLGVWEFRTNPDYKWAGFGLLGGLFVICTLLGAYMLAVRRFTKRTAVHHLHQEANDETIKQEIRALKQSLRTNTLQEVQTTAGTSVTLPFKSTSISFRNLHYTVPIKKNRRWGEKKLLTNINGFAKAGTLTALMGSSGAGKTTLMDVIAGRKTFGKIEGDIKVNGYKQDLNAFAQVTAYVEQMDSLLGTATVRETIEFSAKLRLPPTVTDEQRNAFVNEVLEILELTPIADRLIGDINIPGLSNGEIKLVNIGVELVSNPAVLFLDEPTSGLDSRAALTVMRVVRRIASTGRAVLCTIHQPSAELFYMFDRLLLLKTGGQQVYFGDVGPFGHEVVEYFENASIDTSRYSKPQLPEHTNPANWMLSVIGAGTKGLSVPDYAAVYASSKLCEQNRVVLEQMSVPSADVKPLSFTGYYQSTRLTQFSGVLVRTFTDYYRNVHFNFFRICLQLFLGFVYGLVFLQINDSTQSGLNSKLSAIFISVSFCGMINSGPAVPVLIRNRVIFYREHATHTYTPFAYSTSLMLVEVLYVFIGSISFILPYYFLVGFQNDVQLFFKYVLAHFLFTLSFNYIGQFLASLAPTAAIASMLTGIVFTFFFLFGGTFIRTSSIPIGWKWFYYINPIPKAVIALTTPQFDCNPDLTIGGLNCPRITVVQSNGQTANVFTHEYVSQFLESEYGMYWIYVGWLVLTIVVVRILVAITLAKIRHVKR